MSKNGKNRKLRAVRAAKIAQRQETEGGRKARWLNLKVRQSRKRKK